MPVIDFPNSPSAGNQFTHEGKTWEYDGDAWNLVGGSLDIATGSVTSAKLASNSVIESKIAVDAVTTTKIANSAVTAAKLATDSVTTSKLADLSVTTGKLADGSVTAIKIPDGSIASAKLVAGTIVEANLANGSVTENKLGAGSVTTTKLGDGSVTTDKVANDAITLGTKTTGNYVANLVAGTGVTLSNNSGEGATPTVAIGQAVSTTSEVTFSNLKTTSVIEPLSISATAATGTVAIDAANGTTYYTANATANWVVNLRWNSTTTLDSKLAVGEMTTASFMVRQGSTAYYPTSIQVNGTTTGVTTRWQGTTGAPTAGNANSTDMYTFTTVKTGAATFDVFAAQTRFA